jgi:hypothetical protein
VCAKWRADKEIFFEWVLANGWSHDLQIDRRNNDKGYSPENCRFVDNKTQRANCSPTDSWSLGQLQRYTKRYERIKTSKAVKRSWEKPSRRKKQTKIKIALSTPEYLAMARQRQKDRWADPEWRTSRAIKKSKRKKND